MIRRLENTISLGLALWFLILLRAFSNRQWFKECRSKRALRFELGIKPVWPRCQDTACPFSSIWKCSMSDLCEKPNNKQRDSLARPRLCYLTQHAPLPCPHLPGPGSPLIAWLFSPLTVFIAHVILDDFSMSSRNQDQRQTLQHWRFTSFNQIISHYKNMRTSRLSAGYLKIKNASTCVCTMWWTVRLRANEPLIRFWWWSRSGVFQQLWGTVKGSTYDFHLLRKRLTTLVVDVGLFSLPTPTYHVQVWSPL